MSDPIFLSPEFRPTLAEVVAWTGASAPAGARLDAQVETLAPPEEAGAKSLTFFDDPHDLDVLRAISALACFLAPHVAAHLPKATLALVTDCPFRDFALVLGKLHPRALRAGSLFASNGISPGASIHPEARVEPEVIVDPGAVIGPKAEIGSGSIIGSTVVIGPSVKIGRGTSIGPGARIANALIGNRVVIHAGAAIGLDGFGFLVGSATHTKVAHIGRVIIQDDVEVGANAAIDRGALRDTVIGEGTKIGNLAQIAADVRIGRHCLIAAQAGVLGRAEVEDFVVVGNRDRTGLVANLRKAAEGDIGRCWPDGARPPKRRTKEKAP